MSSPSPAVEVRELLDFAVALAHIAGDHTLRWFGRQVDHAAKGDGTPVTVADREAEALLRERISARFPDHGVLGEEFGETNPGALVRWILDPIDGTRAFMRAVPLYGVLVAAEVEGVPVVGVAHFPALRETVAAASGLGCTWNGEPCRVSPVKRLSEALVLATDPQALVGDTGWAALLARAGTVRGWSDCYGHALVATGRAEVMVDPVMHAWDSGPFLPILTEAGGRFTTREGEQTIHGTSAVSTNGALHAEVLELLAR